jgi:hypothetical protein
MNEGHAIRAAKALNRVTRHHCTDIFPYLSPPPDMPKKPRKIFYIFYIDKPKKKVMLTKSVFIARRAPPLTINFARGSADGARVGKMIAPHVLERVETSGMGIFCFYDVGVPTQIDEPYQDDYKAVVTVALQARRKVLVVGEAEERSAPRGVVLQ